jgi:Cu(I)/Ag(I) efflux system membrane fusion protein
VEEGSYVQTGIPLFHIADLRKLWLLLDAYESDLMWLRLGQKVEFSVEAYPGEQFSGSVSFIDPVVNPQTRTVKVRVIIVNNDGRLKPDMFVKALVKASLSTSGAVKNTALRGKWLCPMHPQIVKNEAGTCDICGMPLVRAEELGYVTSGFEDVNPLVIPATAPLYTGERSLVYVELPDTGKPTYEARTVELGPRVGAYYIVKSGIAEGERVVVNGSFKIDAELQIRAKPSMMDPGAGK